MRWGPQGQRLCILIQAVGPPEKNPLENAEESAHNTEDQQAQDQGEGLGALLLDEEHHQQHDAQAQDTRIDGVKEGQDLGDSAVDGNGPVQGHIHGGGGHGAHHHQAQDRSALGSVGDQAAAKYRVDEAQAHGVAQLDEDPLHDGLGHTVEQDEHQNAQGVAGLAQADGNTGGNDPEAVEEDGVKHTGGGAHEGGLDGVHGGAGDLTGGHVLLHSGGDTNNKAERHGVGVEEGVVADIGGALGLLVVAINSLNGGRHGHGKRIGLHLGHGEVHENQVGEPEHFLQHAVFSSGQSILLSH